MDSDNKNLLDQLRAELEEKTKWAFALTDTVENYKEKVDELRSELEERTKWAKKLNKQIEQKTTRISTLQQEVEKNTNWGKSLNEQINEKTARITTLQQEIEEKTNWGKNLNEQTNEKTARITTLQQEVEEKNTWAKNLNSELENLKEQRKDSEKNISTLNSLLNNATSELEQAKTKLEQTTTELEQTTTELEQTTTELEQTTTELEQTNTELGQTIADLTTTKDEVVELNKKSEYLWFELNNHKAEIQRIRNGLSFRLGRVLTWPLRFLFPPQSKRRLLLKIIFGTIRHPLKFLKKINLRRIKKLAKSMFIHDANFVEEQLNSCLEKNETISAKPQTELNVINNVEEYKPFCLPPTNNPTVSIIIPVYNNWDLNYKCVLSILENTDPTISYEILIADDCSTDETQNISKVIENIIHVKHPQNYGFLGNCNEAAKVARGKYLFFLNNDTQVQSNWLKSLVDLMEKDKKIGMTGSKLVYPDGALQEAGGIIWKDATGWNFGRNNDPTKPEFNYLKEVDYISGAAIMIRHDLWKEIGGFDERYKPAYFEDTDLAFEVRNKGYKVIFQPKSIVIHYEGKSHGTDEASGLKQYQTKNREKFLQKWQDVLEKNHFKNGENVFLARDRSKDKKTVLIIDHYVPTYDKDCGSRMVYQYVKIFVELGYNVKFLGDNFNCEQPYTDKLEQMGVEILYGQWYKKNWEEWLKENGQFIDVAFLNRGHIAIKYINALKKHTSAKLVYLPADLSYVREHRQFQITKDKKHLELSKESKKREFEIFKNSDVVTVVSTYEQKLLQKDFPNKSVEIFPVYTYKGPFPLGENNSFEDRNSITFVGGFMHQPNIDAMLWFVKEIFPKITTKIPEIKLNIIGSFPPNEIMDLQSKNINVTGFISDKELEKYYGETRIAIAPLRFGAGVKGKIIEAAARGIPVITTSIGMEGIPESEQIGYALDDEISFAETLINLWSDQKKWEQFRNQQIAYIEKHVSNKHVKNIVEKVFTTGDSCPSPLLNLK